MKVLVDVNLSPAWAAVLAAHHVEAVHWTSVGDPRAADAELMAYARDPRAAGENPQPPPRNGMCMRKHLHGARRRRDEGRPVARKRQLVRVQEIRQSALKIPQRLPPKRKLAKIGQVARRRS